jgi:sodium-independent sulfate anion transporter 11
MIALSLFVLLFRTFQAHGSFLGYVKIKTLPMSPKDGGSASDIPTKEDTGDIKFVDTGNDNERTVVLPLNRQDGSNPRVQLDTPEPGIFIYRLKEGFNYANCSKQLDEMVEAVTIQTRRGQPSQYERPGVSLSLFRVRQNSNERQDRPWNDSTAESADDGLESIKPLLEAIVLDFSTVDNVDLTSIQDLIDMRNVLDKHAAPHAVQWHFACVHNVWSKRALAAAGFGYPSFETADGRPQHFKSIYSLAEKSQADTAQQRDSEERAREEREREPSRRKSVVTSDIESAGAVRPIDESEKFTIETLEVTDDGKITKEQMDKMEAIQGINRPFFHPDVQSALTSAIGSKHLQESI